MPSPTDTSHQYQGGKGWSKSTETKNREMLGWLNASLKIRDRRNSTEPKKEEGMLGWLNASLKRTETRDELSTTLYLQSKINFF